MKLFVIERPIEDSWKPVAFWPALVRAALAWVPNSYRVRHISKDEMKQLATEMDYCYLIEGKSAKGWIPVITSRNKERADELVAAWGIDDAGNARARANVIALD